MGVRREVGEEIKQKEVRRKKNLLFFFFVYEKTYMSEILGIRGNLKAIFPKSLMPPTVLLPSGFPTSV